MKIIRKGLVISTVGVVMFNLGYNTSSPDYRYEIEKQKGEYYLIDKEKNQKKKITDTFGLEKEEKISGLLEQIQDLENLKYLKGGQKNAR